MITFKSQLVFAPVFRNVLVTIAAVHGTWNSTEAMTYTLLELKGMC